VECRGTSLRVIIITTVITLIIIFLPQKKIAEEK